MRLKIEGQKRDPKIGKKYIILIYQRIREEVQFPLSLRNGENVKISFNEFRPEKILKPREVYSFNQL